MTVRYRHGWAALATGIAVVVAALVPATPAAAVDEPVTITGHGWGHGRGMGQYGALGYATTYGWRYSDIVGHYYGGTTLSGDAGNPLLSVELTRLTGTAPILTGAGLVVDGQGTGTGALRVLPSGGGYQVQVAGGCGGPWSDWGPVRAAGLTVQSADGLVIVCEPERASYYRGAIQVVTGTDGRQYTLNVLPAEDYLRGVVPRESPASWGSLPNGLEALKAQAVAARSYALASARPTSGATTCDTTSCQVYLGYAEQAPYGSYKPLEDSRTDTAIAQTAGQVMRQPGGAIARTEFSSSTGGWTAAGAFTAVEDLGDAVSSNPNHTWTVSTTLPAVAQALGTGPIRSIAVTGRNGLGAEGGRVTQVTVVPVSGAARTFTGNQVRTALGLKSDWFSISSVSVAASRSVVQALYQDVLGRQPDPAGLDYWTAVVTATGDASRVTAPIVSSRERLTAFVTQVYADALHRAPEAGGLEYWIGYLASGQGVSALQVSVFASPESLQVLGNGNERDWVGGMYQALLQRPAAPGEIDYWTGIAQQYGRGAAVVAIARSDEAGLRRLTGYYQQFLGRGLDPSGQASWLPLMAERGDFTLPALIGASPEYWARAQTRFP
jgi:SpoIID/LytB domain protein